VERTGVTHERIKPKDVRSLWERNLIDMLNPKGSTNPIRPKFDPEDPMGKTLIMPVVFLYPEHVTSDTVPEFVEDTSFGAHLAVMLPRDSRDTEGKYVEDGSLVVRDDEEEDALESWVEDDAWLMIATGWRLSMGN